MVGSLADQGGLLLKAGPGAEGEADIPAVGVHTVALHHPVDDFGGGGREDDCGVGGLDNLRVGDLHAPQLLPGVGVPESDDVHPLLEHPGGPGAVSVRADGADAAAVHEDLVAQDLGR